MNMISELRQRVRQNGKAEITPEEFDRLQAEWITRTGAEDMVQAEREVTMLLLKHIDDVVDDANWERIDTRLWNAVATRSNAELCGGPSGPSERAPGYASADKQGD